ncbi:MAG: hypothetical protein WDN26_02795 [Chitinophagaceae bacterium]
MIRVQDTYDTYQQTNDLGRPTFSFRKMRASTIEKTGEVVVPSNARLMAEVEWAPTYTNVLNKETPVSAAKKKKERCCLMICRSAIKLLIVNGIITSVAVPQRKNCQAYRREYYEIHLWR